MAVIPNFPQNLKDLHHNWHQPGTHPGAGPGRLIPPGQPGAGLEFLTFHRNFVDQFHAWYDSQPFADQAAVAPWTAIPPEVKAGAVGWNSTLATQEARITTNTNPPFGSADELGTYIEFGIHGWIHGAVALAFNEPAVADFHSPVSTLFYKIHGLVDHWWTQWQKMQKSPKEFIKEKEHFKDLKDQTKELSKELTKEQFKEFLEPKGPKEFLEPKGPKDFEPKEQFKEFLEPKGPKEFLEPKGPKEFLEPKGPKEFLEPKGPKDFEPKGPKDLEPKGPKEKDKDIFEVPGRPGIIDDPIVTQLAQRLSALEMQAVTGRAFIRREERPGVGERALQDEGEHEHDDDSGNADAKDAKRRR